ncbi:MAG: hypothetical protein IJM14_11015 [Lachnospiraceae bacterium]|nr:hypothetical protein [Lachnospiraceae bacterium]
MRKRAHCVLFIVLLLSFSVSCNKDNEKTLSKTQSSMEESYKESYNEESIVDDDFGGFSGMINIMTEKNSEIFIPVADQVLEFDNEDNLDIVVYLSFDAYNVENSVPVDLYLFCDGRFLDFSLDNYNYDSFGRVYLENKTEHRVRLSLKGKDDAFVRDLSEVFVLANIDPEFFTDKGYMYEVPNILAFSFYVDAQKYKKASKIQMIALDSDYLDGKGEFLVDVGAACKESGEDESVTIWDPDFQTGKKMCLSKKNEEMYAKAYLDNDIDMDCYFFVFCDGEVLPAFDGAKVLFFDNEKGSRVLNYKITRQGFPSLGEHAVQGIVIPVPCEIGTGVRGQVFYNNKRYINVVD